MSNRPQTLRELAGRSDSLEEFGRHFRDWLHEFRRFGSRAEINRAIADKPPLLAGRFPQGQVADAWLAAYAEHVAGRTGQVAPGWAASRRRVAAEPWFAVDPGNPAARLAALRDSPSAFKKRNLFTPAVELPLALRAGRPAKSLEQKRRTGAERQRRFRARRQALLRAYTAQLPLKRVE
ncbi:MAG: hypothetical protein HYV75_09180 [Opitutae bacterium]|nr:hypothetical protein [Opitutae bacterium]